MSINYNKIVKEKATIIWYVQGMRGNAVYRILAAHPEVYWNYHLQQASPEITIHPLELPETISNFNSILPIGEMDEPDHIGYVEKITKLQFGYTTYHTAGYVGDENTNKIIKQWILSKSFLTKKLFLFCHPPDVKLFSEEIIFNLDDKPHIWLYGTKNRLKMSIRHYCRSTNPLAYNLNVDALFSTDYVTFETEYFKLITHFNFTSELNRVRAFILLALEREQYISNFYP